MRFIGTGRGRGRWRGSAKSGAATKKKASPPTLSLLLRTWRYQEGSSGSSTENNDSLLPKRVRRLA